MTTPSNALTYTRTAAEQWLTSRRFLPVMIVPAKRNAERATLRGPGGLMVVLDRARVVPEDPGQDTPAMVYAPFGKGSATLWCAADTGELDSGWSSDGYIVSNQQAAWLNAVVDAADTFLYPASA